MLDQRKKKEEKSIIGIRYLTWEKLIKWCVAKLGVFLLVYSKVKNKLGCNSFPKWKQVKKKWFMVFIITYCFTFCECKLLSWSKEVFWFILIKNWWFQPNQMYDLGKLIKLAVT